MELLRVTTAVAVTGCLAAAGCDSFQTTSNAKPVDQYRVSLAPDAASIRINDVETIGVDGQLPGRPTNLQVTEYLSADGRRTIDVNTARPAAAISPRGEMMPLGESRLGRDSINQPSIVP